MVGELQDLLAASSRLFCHVDLVEKGSNINLSVCYEISCLTRCHRCCKTGLKTFEGFLLEMIAGLDV